MHVLIPPLFPKRRRTYKSFVLVLHLTEKKSKVGIKGLITISSQTNKNISCIYMDLNHKDHAY